MNFLAHLHLSFPDSDEMTGNFMGDFVKGNAWSKYPPKIINGILIHRAIDVYTDKNSSAMRLVNMLKPIYKRYAGVASDMVFDHFLARNFHIFSKLSLNDFAEFTYKTLNDNRHYLPERVAFILDRIRESGRLQMYETLSGVENSFHIMSQRTSLPDNTKELMQFIQSNDAIIEQIFLEFYPQLQTFVKGKRLQFQKNNT